ncbi:MAG: hypothetical protein AAGB93_23565, partial [Planctomycetota bacterium]
MITTALSTIVPEGTHVGAALLATAAVALGVAAGSASAALLGRHGEGRGEGRAAAAAALAPPLLALFLGVLTSPGTEWSPLRRCPT